MTVQRAWHRSWTADIALRALGLALCGVAYAAITHLIAARPPAPPRSAGFVDYSLATIGFLTASAGTALALLGRHLFDDIEISARWQNTPPASFVR